MEILEILVLAGRGHEIYDRAVALVQLFANAGVLREAMRASALPENGEARRVLTPAQKQIVATAVKRVTRRSDHA